MKTKNNSLSFFKIVVVVILLQFSSQQSLFDNLQSNNEAQNQGSQEPQPILQPKNIESSSQSQDMSDPVSIFYLL